jgi:hypothetical protein
MTHRPPPHFEEVTMSGFVATAPLAAPSVIRSGEWYPAIDLAEVRAVLRLDGTVTDARLTECIALAMSAVEDELDAWQQQQDALGRTTLAAVPSKVIGGVSRLVLLYQRAVYATAKAELLERYRDFDSTDTGQRRAEPMDLSVEDYRRQARYAIRDILGRPRATVELL